MRFAVAHKTSSYLMVSCAMLAMITGGRTAVAASGAIASTGEMPHWPIVLIVRPPDSHSSVRSIAGLHSSSYRRKLPSAGLPFRVTLRVGVCRS